MPIRLDARAPDFAQQFRAFLDTKREAAADVEATVRAIIADVVARGDAALVELTNKFDRVDHRRDGLRVTAAEIDAAHAACDRRALDALQARASERIEVYHQRQVPKDDRFTDALGVELGHRWTAIEAVGLYVPGGTAAYPSSVLMNAVPAKVAGVPRIVMVVPAPDGKLSAAGAGGREARRHRRDLSRRRRAGGGGARLRHRRPSSRSPRSSGRATPMWRRPSGWCSARSAST